MINFTRLHTMNYTDVLVIILAILPLLYYYIQNYNNFFKGLDNGEFLHVYNQSAFTLMLFGAMILYVNKFIKSDVLHYWHELFIISGFLCAYIKFLIPFIEQNSIHKLIIGSMVIIYWIFQVI